jgi:hypothetical protein
MYVEKLVSSHSLVKSEVRASLTGATLNDYLFVKNSMDCSSTFDHRPAFVKWLSLRQRRPKTAESVEKLEQYINHDFVKTIFGNDD